MKLSKYKPLRSHLKGIKHFAGRNNQGKITVRHQGGGHKQQYREISWERSQKENIVVNFEYDPNRTSFLAKICDFNVSVENQKLSNSLILNKEFQEKDSFSYILVPKGLKVFDKIQTINEKINNVNIRPGDSSVLYNFEPGDLVHAVESFPGTGAIFARSAGTFCQILQHFSLTYAKIKLPSGSQRYVSLKGKATLGIIARQEFSQRNLKKAGRNRWLNKRPSVRGVAMNPVDHPHGGGQGKTKGGRPSVTPKSWPTKGQPTRNVRKKNLLIVVGRKKKVKK